METDLIKFMENIKMLNKDISIYKNEEKGILFYVNTIQLLAKVERLELSKEEYQKALFEKKINDLEYGIIEVDRPQSKYLITKKQEDMYTIVDSKVKVRQIWNVSNPLGIYKSFTNKEEAMELAEEINKNIITYYQ